MPNKGGGQLMAKSELEKYFRKTVAQDESHFEKVWAPRLRVRNEDGFGDLDFSLSCTPVTEPFSMSINHVHDFDEYFFLSGGDGTNLPDLGGVVELTLSKDGEKMEVFTITEATCVYLPAGLYHCPLNFKKINDPKKPIILQILYFKSKDDYKKKFKDPDMERKIKEKSELRKNLGRL
jgi:hypothetical protein